MSPIHPAGKSSSEWTARTPRRGSDRKAMSAGSMCAVERIEPATFGWISGSVNTSASGKSECAASRSAFATINTGSTRGASERRMPSVAVGQPPRPRSSGTTKAIRMREEALNVRSYLLGVIPRARRATRESVSKHRQG